MSAVQIEVGLDGIAVVFAVGSAGEKCVRLLGGLTMDQLRWIYSSYTDSELEKTGWDPACLANNDFDPNTHLWSELDERCADEEIELVGDKRGEGTFVGFSDMTFADSKHGEVVADNRPSPYVEAYGSDALQYLLTGREGAVAFVGNHFYVATQDVFWAAPLTRKAGGTFVAPSEATIGDRTYPLSRSMFIVIRNTAKVLSNVLPFVQFGFDHPELIRTTGYAPLDDDRVKEMILRLSQGPFTVNTEEDSEEGGKSSLGLILGILAICLLFLSMMAIAVIYFN
jgi:ABC-type phosphate transport system substrate-binding protein